MAVDDFCPRYVNEIRTALHLSEPPLIDQSACRRRQWQHRAYPVAVSEQRIERCITRMPCVFFGCRQTAPLVVDNSHAECVRTSRELAPQFTQAYDAHRRTLQHAHAANARPVRIRCIAAVEIPRLEAGGAELINAE